MAALTAKRSTLRKGDILGTLQDPPVTASAVIFQGAIVVRTAAGYASPGTAATGLTALGVAQKSVTGGSSNGDVTCPVESGVFRFANSGSNTADITDVGALAYIEDDQTVGTDATGRSAAGIIEDVDANGVWVAINPLVRS